MGRPKQTQVGRPQTNKQGGKPVEMRGVKSTNVAAIGYLARKKWLYIRYRGGATYVYYSVPKEEYLAFISAGSKGKYMHYSIKDSYDYDRIS